MKKIKNSQQFIVLRDQFFVTKLAELIYFKCRDLHTFIKRDKKKFNLFGLTIFSGMQGEGKSISLVEELEYIRSKYPDGIVIAIDEIQNEFNIYEARNFNMDLLWKITQQRKNGVKIYGTSQHFTRVAKPLREQTFEVVECRTFFSRWTVQRAFDGQEYAFAVDKPLQLKKLHRKFRRNFVQTDALRSLYESYAIIDRLKKINAEN